MNDYTLPPIQTKKPKNEPIV